MRDTMGRVGKYWDGEMNSGAGWRVDENFIPEFRVDLQMTVKLLRKEVCDV